MDGPNGKWAYYVNSVFFFLITLIQLLVILSQALLTIQ